MSRPAASTIKPSRLRPGDWVGIAAPAGPVDSGLLEQAVRCLEKHGYRVRLGRHVEARKKYLAGTDAQRLEDLHSLWADGSLKAIIFARGGYGSMRLLGKMDFRLLRSNPKILVGSSDLTALLMAAYCKAHLVTFHGPMLGQLVKAQTQNATSLLEELEGRAPALKSLPGARTLLPGRRRGVLLGGNLTVLCHLMGTGYRPSFRGAVLLLEDVHEPLYKLDRMLTQLRLSRSLERARGFVLGCFKDCGAPEAVEALFQERLGDLNLPIMISPAIGHDDRNLTLPLGVRVELDSVRGAITTLEEALQ